MYIKILSNDDSYAWGGTLRPEKVTVGKLYEVLEVHSWRGYKTYAIHPDHVTLGTWWIHEEDESGNSLRHHFLVLSNTMCNLPLLGV